MDNHKEQAAKIYEELIERNPDNIFYYKKLEECLDLSMFLLRNNYIQIFFILKIKKPKTQMKDMNFTNPFLKSILVQMCLVRYL